MIIAFQGVLIDTAKIYAVTPLKETTNSWISIAFTIKFFNENVLHFRFPLGVWVSPNYYVGEAKSWVIYVNEKSAYEENTDFIFQDNTYESKDYLLQHPIYLERKNKIQEGYNGLVKLWQDNQADIPRISIQLT